MSACDENAIRINDLRWTSDDFKSWLFIAFGNNQFLPLSITSEPRLSTQIYYLFCAADPVLQEKVIKRGLIAAMAEWQPESHGYDILKQFALVGAHIKAAGMATQIGSLLCPHSRYFTGPLSSEAKAARDELVSTLCGLSFSPDGNVIMESLFMEDGFDEYAAQFLLGLCRANPHHFTRYVSRFIEIEHRRPDAFYPDVVVEQLVEIVTPAGIAVHFGDLPRDSATRLIEYLCSIPQLPPIRRTMELLFFETTEARPHGERLFLGLCEADPESYMRFAGTLVSHMKEGWRFDLKNMQNGLLKIVSEDVIKRHLHDAQRFNAEPFVLGFLKGPVVPFWAGAARAVLNAIPRQSATRPSPLVRGEAVRHQIHPRDMPLAEVQTAFGPYNVCYRWIKD